MEKCHTFSVRNCISNRILESSNILMGEATGTVISNLFEHDTEPTEEEEDAAAAICIGLLTGNSRIQNKKRKSRK